MSPAGRPSSVPKNPAGVVVATPDRPACAAKTDRDDVLVGAQGRRGPARCVDLGRAAADIAVYMEVALCRSTRQETA